ncbi:MAG: hypothetical protein ACRCV5_03650 [Afipia sp.]
MAAGYLIQANAWGGAWGWSWWGDWGNAWGGWTAEITEENVYFGGWEGHVASHKPASVDTRHEEESLAEYTELLTKSLLGRPREQEAASVSVTPPEPETPVQEVAYYGQHGIYPTMPVPMPLPINDAAWDEQEAITTRKKQNQQRLALVLIAAEA